MLAETAGAPLVFLRTSPALSLPQCGIRHPDHRSENQDRHQPAHGTCQRRSVRHSNRWPLGRPHRFGRRRSHRKFPRQHSRDHSTPLPGCTAVPSRHIPDRMRRKVARCCPAGKGTSSSPPGAGRLRPRQCTENDRRCCPRRILSSTVHRWYRTRRCLRKRRARGRWPAPRRAGSRWGLKGWRAARSQSHGE